MALLTTFRQRQIPRARRVLGVLVVVWFNLALQPCAMAIESVGDHNCPHCPPPQTHQHEGHDMAAGDMAERDMRCATGAAHCSASDSVNIDVRSGQPKLKNILTELPVAIAPFSGPFADVRPQQTIVELPSHRQPPDSSPPLNVLYCVYLI